MFLLQSRLGAVAPSSSRGCGNYGYNHRKPLFPGMYEILGKKPIVVRRAIDFNCSAVAYPQSDVTTGRTRITTSTGSDGYTKTKIEENGKIYSDSVSDSRSSSIPSVPLNGSHASGKWTRDLENGTRPAGDEQTARATQGSIDVNSRLHDWDSSRSNGVQDFETEDEVDLQGEDSEESVPSNELLRRKKISEANKGRVPWNKGKRHSTEVKSLIAQRTKEAMARPEVRAKLRKGNRNRPPHRDDVKERIRTNLKARSDRIKEELRQQADLVIEAMQQSDSEVEREAASYHKAHETFVKLGWRTVRTGHDRAFEQWRDNENDLREKFTARLVLLRQKQIVNAEKARAKRVARGARSRTSKSKVRLAMSTQKQLIAAQEKLKEAEIKVQKMNNLRSALSNDKSKLEVLIGAQSQAEAVLSKLRERVNELSETMSPLQQYLDPKDSTLDAMKAAAASRASFAPRIDNSITRTTISDGT